MLAKFAPTQITLVLTFVGLLVLTTMVAMSFWMVKRTRESTEVVLRTRELRSSLVDLLSVVQDAETGQRGFLITGEPRYLQPYETALQRVAPSVARVQAAIGKAGRSETMLEPLQSAIDEKISELAETVALKRAGKDAEARAIVLTDRGKNRMDDIRGFLQQETVEVDRQILASIETQRSNADLLRGLVAGGGILIVYSVPLPPGRSATIRAIWCTHGLRSKR